MCRSKLALENAASMKISTLLTLVAFLFAFTESSSIPPLCKYNGCLVKITEATNFSLLCQQLAAWAQQVSIVIESARVSSKDLEDVFKAMKNSSLTCQQLLVKDMKFDEDVQKEVALILSKVTILKFVDCDMDVSTALEGLTMSPVVQYFYLENIKLSPTARKHVSDFFSNASEIKQIQLKNVGDGNLMQLFTSLGSNPSLHNLLLRSFDLTEENVDAFITALSERTSKDLFQLTLSEMQIAPEAVKKLATAGNLGVKLSLIGLSTKLDDESASLILKNQLQLIEPFVSFMFINCELSDKFAEDFVSQLSSATSIKKILVDLSDNKFSFKGISDIIDAFAKKSGELKSFEVRFRQIIPSDEERVALMNKPFVTQKINYRPEKSIFLGIHPVLRFHSQSKNQSKEQNRVNVDASLKKTSSPENADNGCMVLHVGFLFLLTCLFSINFA